MGSGEVRLRWSDFTLKPRGYDVLRSVDDGDYEVLTSCTRTRTLDASVLRGHRFKYRVVPYDAGGVRGEPSNVVEIELDETAF